MAISSSLVLPVISSTWMPRSLKIASALGSILSLMRTLGAVIGIAFKNSARSALVEGQFFFWTSEEKSGPSTRSEEHTSELQSLMRISYAVFCLQKNNKVQNHNYCLYHYSNN